MVEFDREVPPGGTGRVLVKLDSEKVKGLNLTKSVKIQSNDTANVDFPLHMTGDILQVLDADPPVARLAGLSGTPLASSLTLKKGAWLDISEVISVEPTQKNVKVGAIETVTPGTEFRLALIADPASTPGMFRDELVVRVRTSDGEERQVKVGAQIEHNPRVVFEPRGVVKFLAAQIQSLRQPNPSPVTRTIQLRSGGEGVAFRVLEVRLEEKLQGVFRTEVVPVTEGSLYKVLIHLDAWQDVKEVIGRMTIVTDDPDHAETSVWLIASFGNAPSGASPALPAPAEAAKKAEPGHEGHDHPGGGR